MPVAAASAPISAYRYHALAARLGDDGMLPSAERLELTPFPADMFSSDFTPEEYQARLGHVQVPVLMCFSTEDQYVPKCLRNGACVVTHAVAQQSMYRSCLPTCARSCSERRLSSSRYNPLLALAGS
jgi:hypothetical protein